MSKAFECSCKDINKKHIYASVKERPQTYLFPQKKFISLFYTINIFNTIYYFKPTKIYLCIKTMPFVNSTLFRFCLPRIETKNKIRCIDDPKYAFTQKSTRIRKAYLNLKSLDSFILESRDN